MRIPWLALLLPFMLLAGAAALRAQVPFFRGARSPWSRIAEGVLPEERSGFTFCRLVYTSTRREAGGSGWNTDFPLADENLMIRFSEFTNGQITTFPDGAPAHALVRGTDAALFQCPFLFASDIGTVTFDEVEVVKLREYLLKGGLLWVDDFWGSRAWANWTRELARIFPEHEIVELSMEHPLFSSFYFVEEIPQIPSIQHWRRSGGETSERGSDSATPRMLGLSNEKDQLMVIMTHNTDIADGWEREAEELEFFYAFSPYAYAIGINIAIWSMTH